MPLPLLAGWFALVTAGLALLGLLIMLLVFGNQFTARFALTGKGCRLRGMWTSVPVHWRAWRCCRRVAGQTPDGGRRAAGDLHGTGGLDWAGAFGALPRGTTIALRNQWRDLLHIIAVPTATSRCGRGSRRCWQTRARPSACRGQRRPAAGAVGDRTGGASCLPLFALRDISDLDILWPLLIMGFHSPPCG